MLTLRHRKNLDRIVYPWQCRLLQVALAEWPRREAPMLTVNCGKGEFLPFLWQAGFELIATESSASLRRQAARRNVPNLMIHGASEDDLPFEDETFDWTIVHLRSADKDKLEKISLEALRVTRRGLMFTFWNHNSFPVLGWRALRKRDWPLPSARWSSVLMMARKLGAGKVRGFTILQGPVCSWDMGKSFEWLNGQISSLPFGAWAVVRVDVDSVKPYTSMPLRLDATLKKVDQVMDWAHKRSKNSKKDINP